MPVALAFALLLAQSAESATPPLAAPSAAASPDDVADARCAGALIATSEKMKKPREKASMDATMMFYIGKIIGRSGDLAVKPALTAAAAALTPAEVPELAARCASDLERAVSAL